MAKKEKKMFKRIAKNSKINKKNINKLNFPPDFPLITHMNANGRDNG
jgi:hypothetical protein